MTEDPQASPPADPENVARAIVLRRLTMAPRTRAELAKTLRERLVPEDVAHRVLDRFTELGLVNDQLYAQTFTENRRSREGWSRRAIAAKLKERGVPRQELDDVLGSVTAEDEERTALDLAHRRWPRLRELEPAVRRRRLAGLLSRRGYSSSIVASVIAAVQAEAGEDLSIGAETDS